MATMANYNTRRGHGSNIMEYRTPNVYLRRTESNLESDFAGTQMFEMPPDKGLRRISSTLDFFSGHHHSRSSVFQSGAGGSYKAPQYKNAASHMGGVDHGHGIIINNRAPSSRIPCPPPGAFFGNEGVILREKAYVSTQQPISRPPKLVVSNSDPTAATSMQSNAKFPQTSNGFWATHEDAKQPPRLRKENTMPLPKLTTQPEWPLLRHQNGLARANRGWESKEEREAISKKNFEDSLFPGGLDAFMQLNLKQRAMNTNGIQLCLASPTLTPTPMPFAREVPSPQSTYPALLKVMSGKRLIQDLQAYEHNGQPIPTDIGHFNDTNNLKNYVDKGPEQNKFLVFSDPKPEPPTHDADGRKNKGFRRGDGALRLAITEKWACMAHHLNSPFEPVPYHSRFFVIKSNCELDIFASLKHGIWTSTDLGNKRLDRAFRDTTKRGPIYLFFSVSGSGKFCGLAEMTSTVDLTTHAGIWSDKRWRGRFNVKWKIIKDIVNSDLRQYRVANNDNKPFTNCRDTQEILPDVGESVFHLFSNYISSSSLLQSAYPAPKYENEEEHRL